MKKIGARRNNNKFCSNLVKSTLRVPVTRLGWKTVHCSRLDFGYIIASRKLLICGVQNPTYSVTCSENLIPALIPVLTSVTMWRHWKLHHSSHLLGLLVITSLRHERSNCAVSFNVELWTLSDFVGHFFAVFFSRTIVLCHSTSRTSNLCHEWQCLLHHFSWVQKQCKYFLDAPRLICIYSYLAVCKSLRGYSGH